MPFLLLLVIGCSNEKGGVRLRDRAPDERAEFERMLDEQGERHHEEFESRCLRNLKATDEGVAQVGMLEDCCFTHYLTFHAESCARLFPKVIGLPEAHLFDQCTDNRFENAAGCRDALGSHARRYAVALCGAYKQPEQGAWCTLASTWARSDRAPVALLLSSILLSVGLLVLCFRHFPLLKAYLDARRRGTS